MVLSEVESRATRVHDYYTYQWDDLQRDRLQLYADFIRLNGRYTLEGSTVDSTIVSSF